MNVCVFFDTYSIYVIWAGVGPLYTERLKIDQYKNLLLLQAMAKFTLYICIEWIDFSVRSSCLVIQTLAQPSCCLAPQVKTKSWFASISALDYLANNWSALSAVIDHALQLGSATGA